MEEPLIFNIDSISKDNYFLKRFDGSYERFLLVYNGDIPYIEDDYPLLIQNIERLYKGICKELQILYPDKIKITEQSYIQGHHLHVYAQQINKIIHLSDTKEGSTEVLKYINRIEIEKEYNTTRYSCSKSFSDFKKLFDRYEKQAIRLFSGLEKEIQKDKKKEEDELSLF